MTDFSRILAGGPETTLIPGPSILPDRVRAAMGRSSIDIYSGSLLGVTARCEAGLREVFGTTGEVFIYAANGHGAWDAALSNTLSRGDKILVLQSGRFASGWGEMASAMGLDVEVLPRDWHSAIDLDAVTRRLAADKAHSIRAVLCVQVDTASGVSNDIGALRQAIDNSAHPALLMVDAVASLGTMAFEFDNWTVDVAVSASQKGLMSPAGLGFVAASEQAMEAGKTAGLRTRYWDWQARNTTDHYQKYCGTPPEQLLFGLAEAFDMMAEEGLPSIFKRHEILKQATQAAILAWGCVGATANVTDPKTSHLRSRSSTYRMNWPVKSFRFVVTVVA
ncbi:aminotransferase class V-fold PLP-dependent enzyme (plasmid) [Parasedimentitalea marina]|uniref:Aminotransferase class V-fold PLP-dependent enzyme n=1 Tax=Parasedimentitalea marina TaxID=2483033 RepID=A0A3T0NA01_9RHOB|nr:aminotransferase class V-fold PLP-dependent enzyme [Parasedimentitalea marina]AZV80856.1 aminotransferase class V-fold PLP-dependent enzyme [Parasedimentitalea marina]